MSAITSVAALMLFRLAIVVSFLLALAGCNREPYSRSNSGFSSLDKKVLYDFRRVQPADSASDEAARRKVLAAISRDWTLVKSETKDCPRASAFQVPGFSDGTFTAAGLRQTVYLVNLDECTRNSSETTRRLVVFTGGAVTADVEVPGADAILGSYDVNGDRRNELLLEDNRGGAGERIKTAQLVEFDKDKLKTVEDFGQIYDDTCDSGLPSKSISASIVYYLPPPAGQKPRFTVELYRAPCPANGQPPEWTLVSGK